MLKSVIQKYATGKNALLFFILSSIVYAYMLTTSIPQISAYANGMKILDMMPTGYDTEYVHLLFSELGTEGRNTYLFHQIPLDFVYPFLYGIGYALLIAFILIKTNRYDTSFFYLCLLPLAAALLDYLENIGTMAMLFKYPNTSNFQINLNSTFTILKSIFSSGFFIALICLLIDWGIKRIKKV